ncbi:MAG: c-type cytochrome, partial [Marinosulfonomonas sp.]|nr:c-type cytochrome [Marinosulfonomonas sp.]
MRYSTVFTAFALMIGASQTSAQHAAAGEAIFKKCAACHQIGDGANNGAGPILTGVIGRPAGSVEGFK